LQDIPVSVIQYSPALDALWGVNAHIFTYSTLQDAFNSLDNQTTSYFLSDQGTLILLNSSSTIYTSGPSFSDLDYVISFSPSDSLNNLVVQINQAIALYKISPYYDYKTWQEQFFQQTLISSNGIDPFIIIWSVCIGVILIVIAVCSVVMVKCGFLKKRKPGNLPE